jgi:quercetin dioxygenase-like cupin family protein
MSQLKVVRLAETSAVKFGPDAVYQLLIGDEEGTTPVRVGIQTSEPGYEASLHAHPYLEILHVLDGQGEFWLEGQEDAKAILEPGDTVALPPGVNHSFRVVGTRTLRTLGIHTSPRRLVSYRDGRPTDASGYPTVELPPAGKR